MKKILKWIKKNTGLFIVFLLTFILFIFVLVILVKLLIGNSSGNYGNRLDGIDDVVISDETYEGVKEEIIDSELASDVSIRLQGKIIYTTIVLNSDTGISKAKQLASSTLDNYTEEELSFYDFSFFLKWENEEDGDTVITGNKHHDLDSITWIKS